MGYRKKRETSQQHKSQSSSRGHFPKSAADFEEEKTQSLLSDIPWLLSMSSLDQGKPRNPGFCSLAVCE